MVYIILFTLATLITSFLVGVLVIHKFKINLKYVTFALPMGTLVFFGILQIIYMLFTYLIRLCTLLIPTSEITTLLCTSQPLILTSFTLLIPLIILFLFIKEKSKIKYIIKNQFSNKWKFLTALGIFLLLLFVFVNTQISFRTDDMNFYGPYITNRIYNTENSMVTYDYQGFFTYLSVLVNSVEFLPSLGRFSSMLPLAYIEWIPALLMMSCLSFTLADFIDFIKEKISNKYLLYFVYSTTLILVFVDYWYTVYPHFGNTLRRLSIIYILYFIYEQIKGKFDFKYLLMLLFSSFVFFSSTSFFISVFIAYGYLLYSMKNNKHGYLKEISISYIIPFLFFLAYLSTYIHNIGLYVLLVVFFVLILIALVLFKNSRLESFLNKSSGVVLYGVPIIIVLLTVVLSKQLDPVFTFVMGSRNFFSAVNFFDMVPDIVNADLSSNMFTLVYNVLFWIITFVSVIKLRKTNNFFIFLLFVTVITFFNPFVYRFICGFITSTAYFRITDIFYNIVVIGSVFISLLDTNNKWFKSVIIGMMILLVIFRGMSIEISSYVPKEEMNKVYRVPQMDYDVTKHFENNILQFEDKESYKVISHVYGIENLTRYHVDNLLEDRFAYIFINNQDAFQTMFARRYPGYNLPEVSYEKACALAFERDVDYAILDAQYNWMLQEGLWPCSVVIEEYDVYRVLKMDYEYWEENIKLGYVNDYR